MQKTNRVLLLAALMALATACKKDPTPTPQPTPNQPTDTITPVDTTNIHKKIVLIWDWYYDGVAPNRDTVKYYANRSDFDTIILMPDSTSELSNRATRGFNTWNFHRARDTLQKCINFAPNKVRGYGKIYVHKINGAQLPPDYDVETTKFGMSLEDSLWYTANGWRVERGQ